MKIQSLIKISVRCDRIKIKTKNNVDQPEAMQRMVFRKLKASTTRRRFYVYCGALVVSAFLLYVVSDRISCLDLVIDFELSRDCSRYFKNEITGNYCPELCAGETLSSFSCQPNANLKWLGNKNGKMILLNRATTEEHNTLSWINKDGELSYPSTVEFENLVKRLISINFNRTISQEQLNAIIHLKNENNPVLFRASQVAAWTLIQDNDYLIASLFEDKELFPRVYGTCGNIFFTEYLGQPVRVERGHELTLAGWKMNIKMAVLILDFIEELEQSKLVMCDIDTDQFGIVDNRMKYGDMKIIFSEHFINRILRNGKSCTDDTDCVYRGCKSVCHKTKRVCLDQQNNNLQLVCEKVFKGTTMNPGILLWNRTPKPLRQMVERCANPQQPRDIDRHKHLAPSTELRNLIYNELANIYETLGRYCLVLALSVSGCSSVFTVLNIKGLFKLD